MWLDDFDKFKVVDAGSTFDAGPRPDAGESPDASDAAADAANAADAADAADASDASDAQSGRDASSDARTEPCEGVDCRWMDSTCAQGVCDPATGECTAKPMNAGRPCFDGNPCTQNDVCGNDGTCAGKPLDCAAFDDECSQGMCDPELGGCTYGPNRMSQACDDANPCTTNDRCGTRGVCESDTDAPSGTSCTDYNACTGTPATPDHCDGMGRCVEGAAVPSGTACDDESECTTDDECNGSGVCRGSAVREGQTCQGACTSNTRCHSGRCEAQTNDAPAYNPRCVLFLCGTASICRSEWERDRVCHCGCGFDDPDCNDCSARMCQSSASLSHSAVRWCDASGRAIGNCPDSLKGDGHCDCGCQFDDPDCSGGSCCGATGRAGCGNAFVEDCVCRHETNPDPSCCDDAWTPRCAALAVSLGCATCP